MAETSPAATPAAPAASFWWTHDSIENVAEPLDPTADDAAAHCLSLITAHTSDHLRRHAALLRPYLTTHNTTITTGAHGVGDAAQLYHQLQWSSVLVPLLGQLRKAMARAWEERVAEQAEAAAATALTLASNDNPTIDVASSPSRTPASSCAAQEAAVCADPVLLRRLRVVQQRIYLAFLKALLQGIISGTRAVVHDVNPSAPEEEKAAAASEKAEAETAQVARGVAVLLDGLLANMIAAAASTTAAAAASRWAAGEASLKARRGHPHSPHASPLSPPVAHVSNNNNGSSVVSVVSAAAATGGGDWFIGMMPSYIRAAQYGSQHADTAAAEAAAGSGAAPNTTTTAATTSDAPSIPSLALCLVSYIGVFVGDAGLQLLPAEQGAQLPYFTQEVETILLRQLTTRSARVVSSTTDSTTSAAVEVVVAQIEEATRFLRHITETQLYHDANGVAVVAAEDDDCTALFAVPSALSRSIASVAASSIPAAAVDYSVASLLSLSSYSACCRLVKELERWWSACRRSMEEIVTGDRLVEAEEKERLAAVDAVEGHDAASAAATATATTEAWMALRRQAMLFTAVLSSYADTSLLLPTYTALLVHLFYPAQDVPLNAWKTCLRDVQHVLRTNHLLSNSINNSSGNGLFSGAATTATTSTSSSSSLSRPLRAHHRHSGGDSFPAASYRRVLSLVSRSAGNALEEHVSNSSEAAPRSTDTAPSVLPLGFSVLHAPLLVLDKIIAATLSSTTVASSLCFDTVVGEKLHQSEKAVAAASPASNTTASSAPPSIRALAMSGTTLSAAEVLALSFPRLYRLLHALDQALQHCVRRAEELRASGTASEVEEENGAWAVTSSALPHHFALFLGAALDDCFTASLRHPTDEVNGSLLLMFYAAIFRMLGRDALPRLRASLSTFLGEDGDGLLLYLRHHIVDQQRRGLVAFFLPPLRALGLDYGACDDTDASLAVAAGPALAYAFELPRLFFFHSSETPVTEVAWSAQTAAQSYLCALLAPNTTAAAAAMLDIVREAGAVARVRAGRSSSSSSGSKSSAPVSSSRGQLSSQAVVNDAMTAFFYAVCRWCMAQLPPTSPAIAARATSFVSSESSFPLESVREVVESALCPPGEAAAAQLPVLTSLVARLRGTSAVADAVAPARAATWIWECSYADVDPVHLQACARRLLRDFTASFSGHAPVRTLLAVRAVVEQRLKVEDAAAAAAAVAAALLAVVRDDVHELVARQEQTRLQEEKAVNEEEAPAKQTSTTAATAEESAETQLTQQDNTPQPDAPRAKDEGKEVSEKAALTPATPAVAATTATGASTRPPSIVAGAELRRYLDSLLDVLLARARLSVVDGAVSAAVLPLLLRVLSDTTLPITMTASDRQRLCERFVFSLTNSIGDLTRAEAVASACCLQLVLANVVIPFKKSFLDTQPSHRVFHGCFCDSEADAFKMVRHTFGDVVTALHKRTDETDAPATLLDDWKTNVMLEHVGPKLCLVRSLLEKVRVSVRRRVLRGRGHCIEVMRHRLQQLEHYANTAGQTSGELAEDVLHLFTLHPPPTTARAAAAVSTTTAAAAVTGAQTKAIGASSAESGRRGAAAAPAAKSAEGATAAMPSGLRERSRRGGGGRRGREERRRGEAASPASSSASPSSPTAATASAAEASASSRQDRGGRDGKRGRDEREERGGGGGGRERRREESPPPKRRRGGRQFRR